MTDETSSLFWPSLNSVNKIFTNWNEVSVVTLSSLSTYPYFIQSYSQVSFPSNKQNQRYDIMAEGVKMSDSWKC